LTAYFTDTFRQAVFDDPALFDTAHDVVAVLFRNAPVFSPDDPRYTGIDTIEELQGTLGWDRPAAQSNPLGMSVSTTVGTRYLRLENPFEFPSDFVATYARAIAFVYQGNLGGVTNPIMMVTNTPLEGGTVIYPGDVIYARPDTTAEGARWLMNWPPPPAPLPDPEPPPTASAQRLNEGPLAMLRGAPPFDTSRTQHVWLYPQRVNLLANPSFETGEVSHWRSNARLIQIIGDSADGGGVTSARFYDASPIIVESNVFPLTFGFATERLFTVMVNARGNGLLRVGLLSWPADYSETITDWGPAGELPMQLSSAGFTVRRMPRDTGGAAYGMLRLECDGDELVLDNLMVEPNWLPDWWYFDGDTLYGAPDDFIWYGGCRGSSYSLWYNNRRAVVGRLFAWQEDPTDQAQILPPTWEFDPTSYDPAKWMTAPPARVLNRLQADDIPVLLDSSHLSPDRTKLLNQTRDDAIVAGTLDGTLTGGIVLTPETRGYWWFPPTANNTMFTPTQPELDITASMSVVAEIEPLSWTPAAEECIISRWGNGGVVPGVPGYLNPNLNGLRSPSPVPAGDKTLFQISGDRTIVARVRFGADNDQYQQIAGVWVTPDYGWFFGVGPDNKLRFHWSANGTTSNEVAFSSVASFGTTDPWIGVKIDHGSRTFQAITSTNGTTWINWGAAVVAPTTMATTFASNSPLWIGAGRDDQGAVVRKFTGRLYSVEMRTGLNPTAGTLQWRMNASEWESGSPWTDDRGRVWTNASGTTITKPTVGTPVNSSWILTLKPDGKLQFLWSTPPPYPWTTVPFVLDESTAATGATGRKFVAVTWLGNNGSGQRETAFWISDDEIDWTQIGTTVKTTGVMALQPSGGRLEVTTRDLAGSTRSMQAKVYSVKVNKGIGARLGSGLPTVRVATTANIALTGLQTIDTVVLAAGNRVLVKNQTTTTQNGIYVVQTTAWTRATDYDTGTELTAAKVNVTAGSANINTVWRQTEEVATVGTDDVLFVKVGTDGSLPGGEAVVNIDLDTILPEDTKDLAFPAATGQTVTVTRGTSGYVATGMPINGRPVVMLDGVNDLVTVPHHATLNVTQPFAVVLAVNQKVAPKSTYYASKVNPSSPYAGWSIPVGAGPQVSSRLREPLQTLETGYTGMALDTTAGVGFSVERSPTAMITTLYTFRDDAAGRSATSSVINLTNVANTQPILVGSGQGPTYEQFDFYALVVVQASLDSNQLASIATALRDASDVYFNGDRWSITAAGTFKGLDLEPGDVLVARHPLGGNSPMGFDQVIWDVQVLTEGVTTNIEVEKQGLVYRWVPAGTLVTPHIGVLAKDDIAVCPSDIYPPVLPYKTDADDPFGVTDPWTT
jgi:hypothetical protein